MKSKKLSLLSLLMLGSISLSSCYVDLGIIAFGTPEEEQQQEQQQQNTNNSSSGSQTIVEGGYTLTPQEDIDAYYSSITNQQGSNLLSALKLIINTSSFKTSYDWSRFEKADEDPANKSNVILIYARTSVKKTDHVSGSTGWNREHTFPQSKLNDGQAESDNHIIFASDCEVNKTRSNYKLGVVSSGSEVYDSYGQKTTCLLGNQKFDPKNEARGIVARATMYAAAMYGYNPTDNFESIATMLKWHNDYPVTKFEQSRNAKIHNLQKNRNPFVDHPEYASKIWGSAS